MPTLLELARKDVVKHFDGLSSKVYIRRELGRILEQNRRAWRLAEGLPFGEFLEYLKKTRKLREVAFPFPHRKEIRFCWGKVAFESVLLTLKPSCHFSHLTAVQLHELTEQDPRTIYLNHEQPPKPASASGLAQGRIDAAFRRKPRMTKNFAQVRDFDRKNVRVCLLNGKHTGYLGVEEREIAAGEGNETVRLRLTDLERTLIDIAVRPFYAGGVPAVITAYRRAAERVSVNRIASLLRKLGYAYPYHQAVGYYLDVAGNYQEKRINRFREGFEYEYDFYLDYGLEDLEYNDRWRVFGPKGMS